MVMRLCWANSPALLTSLLSWQKCMPLCVAYLWEPVVVPNKHEHTSNNVCTTDTLCALHLNNSHCIATQLQVNVNLEILHHFNWWHKRDCVTVMLRACEMRNERKRQQRCIMNNFDFGYKLVYDRHVWTMSSQVKWMCSCIWMIRRQGWSEHQNSIEQTRQNHVHCWRLTILKRPICFAWAYASVPSGSKQGSSPCTM